MSSEHVSREEAEELIDDMRDGGYPETKIRKIMNEDYDLTYSQINSILSRIKVRKPEPEPDFVNADRHPTIDGSVPFIEPRRLPQNPGEWDIVIGYMGVFFSIIIISFGYILMDGGSSSLAYVVGAGLLFYSGWRLKRGLNL